LKRAGGAGASAASVTAGKTNKPDKTNAAAAAPIWRIRPWLRVNKTAFIHFLFCWCAALRWRYFCIAHAAGRVMLAEDGHDRGDACAVRPGLCNNEIRLPAACFE
jgi:hypothetical protein